MYAQLKKHTEIEFHFFIIELWTSKKNRNFLNIIPSIKKETILVNPIEMFKAINVDK